MFFDIADINAPLFIANSGLERVRLRLVWFLGFGLMA